VIGQPIVSVDDVRLGTGGNHGRGEIYTEGRCTATYQHGLDATIRFTQIEPGHRDDIGILVRLKDGRYLLWRLELGVDNLWVYQGSAAPEAPFEPHHGWTRYMRGDSFFMDEVNKSLEQFKPYKLQKESLPFL
jgi:hypothetical protein